jgi:isopentenyldiphosphate isomerase
MKFRMKYGINDNEISLLYEGRIDPAQVKFDPIEIESIQYLHLEQLRKMIKEDRSQFCGWFVEILCAYDNEPTERLQLLEKGQS